MFLNKSRIKYSWFKCTSKNSFIVNKSTVIKSRIYVVGVNNKLNINNCFLENSIITIDGIGNLVEVEAGVKLRKVNLIIRGNNCSVRIGKDTTFGGARIVNVGSDNSIVIGNNCLFADKIEIWASDTHAIYDENGNWINKEKPIIIESNVWVGSKVTILKGVKIGDGSIIGMETLLTKDVKAKTIVAGNPAREIKKNVYWTLDYPLQNNKF
ncbi:acyltransferase [Flavobacterium eburneipallidum]|uniref:acyltransferase n=1 Tax=Flavobacterium eburneipallidum TaxID=3003263 RepID=UPI0022ABC697|nr:acyltransferase [Flavobacterium eburneipallidum]